MYLCEQLSSPHLISNNTSFAFAFGSLSFGASSMLFKMLPPLKNTWIPTFSIILLYGSLKPWHKEWRQTLWILSFLWSYPFLGHLKGLSLFRFLYGLPILGNHPVLIQWLYSSCSRCSLLQTVWALWCRVLTDIFYKLVKSQLGAQYDPKIGMYRSNCLKVYGMSITEVPHTFRQYFSRIYGHTRTHFQLLFGRSVTVGRKKHDYCHLGTYWVVGVPI